MARIYDKGVLGALSVALSTVSLQRLSKLAIQIPSDVPAGSAEHVAVLGSAPSFKEWAGRRVREQPRSFSYTITNKDWRNSGIIPISWVNNDKTGEVQRWIAEFAKTYPLLVEEVLATLLNNAYAAYCITGQYFFSASHTMGASGTFSNLLTFDASAHATITAYEAARGILKAVLALWGMPDTEGRAIMNGDMTDVSVYFEPSEVNSAAIMSALGQKTLDTGAGTVDNPLNGAGVTIHAVPHGLLTIGNAKLIVARSDAGSKPWCVQENEKEGYTKVLTDDRTIVDQDGWEVAAKRCLNAGYGLPQHVVSLEFN